MKLMLAVPMSLLTALTLTACLGSSSSPEQPQPPPPPVGGDIIRYNHLGLEDFAVEYLYHFGDSVWAVGQGAIYVSRNPQAQNENDANWELQLADAHFTHITGFDAETLFAIGVVDDEALMQLYRSQDSGASWQVIKHDFGNSDEVNQSSLQRLVADSATGYLYGVGQDLLAVSYDQGERWEVLWGEPGYIANNFSLKLHQERNDLWWGGQNAIEQSTLQRFSLNNAAHENWNELFPSPSTTEDITFDHSNSDRVLIGTEGGIGLSDNYGNDWQRVIFDGDPAFYMAIVQSREYPDVWYSARWEKGRQQHPLVFEYSKDRGYTWQQSRHPATNENFGMRHMVLLAQPQDGQDILWLGMQNGGWEGGGIMRVSVDLEGFN